MSGTSPFRLRRRTPGVRVLGPGPDPARCRFALERSPRSPFRVVIAPDAVAAMEREARASFHAGRERAGWLVGQVLPGERGVWIAALVPGPSDADSGVAYTFDPEVQARLLDETERLCASLSRAGVPCGRIGWFHTHPGMDVFLSAPDREVHRTAFPAPTDVAVVVAPQREPERDAFSIFHRSPAGLVATDDVWIGPVDPEVPGARLPWRWVAGEAGGGDDDDR